MIRQYEVTYIVDAHLPGEQIDVTIEKISRFIDKNGGKVQNMDRWGKRRLAYEIARKQYGYYVCVRFESGADFVKALERDLKLDDTIIRFLTIQVQEAALQEEARIKSRSVDGSEAGKHEEETEEGTIPFSRPADEPEEADEGKKEDKEV